MIHRNISKKLFKKKRSYLFEFRKYWKQNWRWKSKFNRWCQVTPIATTFQNSIRKRRKRSVSVIFYVLQVATFAICRQVFVQTEKYKHWKTKSWLCEFRVWSTVRIQSSHSCIYKTNLLKKINKWTTHTTAQKSTVTTATEKDFILNSTVCDSLLAKKLSDYLKYSSLFIYSFKFNRRKCSKQQCQFNFRIEEHKPAEVARVR